MASITVVRKRIDTMTFSEIEREIAGYSYRTVRYYELIAERNSRLSECETSLSDSDLVSAIRSGNSALLGEAKARGLQGCDGCPGDGTYPLKSGDVGKCFRCAGKGFQNAKDRARNAKWDAKHPRSL